MTALAINALTRTKVTYSGAPKNHSKNAAEEERMLFAAIRPIK
jgi:hypothetical protein